MKKTALATLVLVAVGLSLYLVFRWVSGPPGGGRPVVFEVERGWGAATVTRALEDSGLARSRFYLLYRAGILDVSTRFQAGSYLLDSSMEPDSLLLIIASGRTIPEPTHWVTIPEGLRLGEALTLMSEQLDIPPGCLEAAAADSALLRELGIPSLEGYLFPETYEFADTLGAEEIIRRAVDTGLDRWDPSWHESFERSGLSDREAVILASIVEREARLDSERPLVAGVFLNRLSTGMRLESCATVQYALGTVRERLSFSDLRIQSPYNTYTHEGLPPGPICSPGLSSIAAVALPDTAAGYLYFVSREDGSGAHLFAGTLAGHNENIRRARSGNIDG